MQHIHQYVTGHYLHAHGLDSVSLAVAGAVEVMAGLPTELHFHPHLQAMEKWLAEHEREAARLNKDGRWEISGNDG